MAQKQPVEDVFDKAVDDCTVAELKHWLSKHRMVAGDLRLRVGGTRR